MKTILQSLSWSLLLLGFLLIQCQKKSDSLIPKSSVTTPTKPSISGISIVSSVFDATTSTYTVTVPAGTDVRAISLSFELPSGATVKPASGSQQNFTNPVTYTVTAEDGSTKAYTVKMAIASAPSAIDKQITAFTFEDLNPVVSATINQATQIIEATVPSFVNITSLEPTITISPKAVVFPASKSRQNFTNPVSYTVTAENGSIQRYEVRVTKKIAVASIIQEVVAGGERSFFIKSDNSLWVAGWVRASGDENQLYNYRTAPTRIMDDIKTVSSGYLHTLFIKTDNSLWSTGSNEKGQLGDGATNLYTERSVPFKIMTDVKAVAAGWYHSLIIKMDNSLWVAGSNDKGELGDGSTYASRSVPIKIMDGVQAVAAGTAFSLILKADNTLWAMGDNQKIQFGDANLPAQITKPVQIASNVKAFAAGSKHILILKADNTLWAAGDNTFGQLMSGITKDGPFPFFQVMADVKAVAAGGSHAIALKTDNTLWAAGSLGRKASELNIQVNDYIPVKVATDVKAISAGGGHTLFIKTDNSVWSMGYNSYGQLANGFRTGYSTSPQRVTLP
ncbi:hypothetical protein M0L20_29470 [Spirosoma sp. RP8]|uniref:RCC1-like domain-containing protein n=1 Tax=Spirosoma liriopis TaxID=2937440 RepID=A0ABT0HV96_9BACT|nr:hypothetical protein [Spirosoma liriopis]MCK8496032.1 hypothetical protein [Spirosoma liriopis]